MKILTGHTSPETAYVVEDYPYGFRLRCKIRYWLETSKKGSRLVSQTTNPKRPGEVWNKPKASTYSRFGGVMLLGEQGETAGHVSWTGLSEYCDGAEAQKWWDSYGKYVAEPMQELGRKFVAAKVAYDANRTKDDPLTTGLVEARDAFIKA